VVPQSGSTGAPIAYVNIGESIDKGWGIERNPKLAAEYVLKGFDLGSKWDDPRNSEIVFSETWSSEFWREIQIRLKQRGHHAGTIDGQLTNATRAAFEKIVER